MLSTSNAVLSRMKLPPSFDGSSYLSNIHKFLRKARTKVIMANIEENESGQPGGGEEVEQQPQERPF